jgi:hypothetical protein
MKRTITPFQRGLALFMAAYMAAPKAALRAAALLCRAASPLLRKSLWRRQLAGTLPGRIRLPPRST